MKNRLLFLTCTIGWFIGWFAGGDLIALAKSARPSSLQTPAAAATLTIKDATGLTVTLTPPLTITSAETVPVPIPTPTPTPTPNPAISIERVREASGAIITSAAGSSIVFIQGSGFGSGGVVKIANQACAVIDYLPYQIAVKLPVVTLTQTGPVVVAPVGLTPASSTFSFAILAVAPVPGPTPTPLPPPPSKRVSVEWPAGSGQIWYEGHLQNGHGPLGSWSYVGAKGLYPEAFSPPYMAAPLTGFKPLTGRFSVSP